MQTIFIFIALLAISAVPHRSTATAAARKDLGQMTIEEVRQEAHKLYRDDVTYAKYIRELTDQADAAWPNLNGSEKIRWEMDVYAQLMEALRLLNDPAPSPADLINQRYQAAVHISLAVDGTKAGAEYAGFYKEIFESRDFKESTSAFHDTAVELWTRYERAAKPVPYTKLLRLNEANMGPPDHVNDEILSSIAEMYAAIGDHLTEAKWYERVSSLGLGPLFAADALFAARHDSEAGEKYRAVLGQLKHWATIKPDLKDTQVLEPLEDADLDEIKAHATTRLAEIDRRLHPTTLPRAKDR